MDRIRESIAIVKKFVVQISVEIDSIVECESVQKCFCFGSMRSQAIISNFVSLVVSFKTLCSTIVNNLAIHVSLIFLHKLYRLSKPLQAYSLMCAIVHVLMTRLIRKYGNYFLVVRLWLTTLRNRMVTLTASIPGAVKGMVSEGWQNCTTIWDRHQLDCHIHRCLWIFWNNWRQCYDECCEKLSR